MAISATGVESAKRIAHLEAQLDKLEKERAELKEDLLATKAREEWMKNKYWKAKGRLAKAKDAFESERSKWRDETEEIWEKFWKAESEKANLRADRTNSEDDAGYATFDAENEGLKCLLEEKEFVIGTLLGENATIEAALVTVEEENLELLQKLEAVKKAMEEEHRSNISVLEKEKREAEDKLVQANRENKEEINKILSEKVTMKEQHDKKILEFLSRVQDMGRDMEAEKANLKEMNSEQFSRIGMLEREKQELEVEARKKDEVIKVLKQQIECLTANKEIMAMEANRRIVIKSEEGVESPTASNQGKRPVDVSVREPERRKLEALGCAVTKQVGTKRYKSK